MGDMDTTTTTPIWTVGDRLAKARRLAGLTQHELADRVGIARSSVANYEGDIHHPRLIVLRAWAHPRHSEAHRRGRARAVVEESRRCLVTPAVFLGTYSHAAPEKDRPIANAIGAAIDAALGT